MAQTHHRDSGNELTINNITDEDGFLKIYGKNADALILGDATHEGGNISVYRDTSGNKQLFVDADAASNTLALSVYGGVVARNYLTVGSTTLNTVYPFAVVGNASISSSLSVTQHITAGMHLNTGGAYGAYIGTAGIQNRVTNQANIPINIDVTGTDAADHAIKLQIDANDIIVAQATGDGAGGITNKAIGLYGTTPATQHAAIADATDAASAITQLNLALIALRAIGLIAT